MTSLLCCESWISDEQHDKLMIFFAGVIIRKCFLPFVGPQAACEGHEDACMCSSQSVGNPEESAAAENQEQAEMSFLRRRHFGSFF